MRRDSAFSGKAQMCIRDRVEIASPNGTRIVPVTDVILRPGKTILEANEAFIRFLFPVPAFKSAFVKLGSRKKVTISRIGVALGLDRCV